MTDSHHAVPEEEPQSPPWLPALGIALFIVAGVVWSVCTGDPGGAAKGAAASGEGAPAASAAPAH